MTKTEAIELLTKSIKWFLPYTEVKEEWTDAMNMAIASLSAETEWIPVSERLPEEEEKKYWVCTDAEYQCECRWTNINHFWTDLTTDWHWHIMDIPQYTKVIAWIPLPKPYGESEVEE